MSINMAKVLNKIRQMQIKLNIINSNIDEIKNERNHFRENRKTTDDFQENKTQKKKNISIQTTIQIIINEII
jgi:hypothetical protein